MGASAILKLQEAGFSTSQVSAIAELVDSQSASKGDLEAVEHRISLKIADLKGDLEGKIADARSSADLRAASIEGRLTLLQWMVGFSLGLEALIFGRLFLK